MVTDFDLSDEHDLMMALTEREIQLSFARKWCNMLLIEELELEIRQIKSCLDRINSVK